MPRSDYKRCRICGRFSKDVGEMSRSRLCSEHSAELLADNIIQMKAHTGPNFRKWRHGMAASVGAVLIDDVISTP